MSTTRIKEKLSKIVSSQLPEFIQTDYTTFVSFLEAYYQFLEQDQGAFELIQNARSYNDLDKTTDSFVNYFLNTYAKDIPQTTSADKRFLIKRIKDLYESKGSELSFKYLFNLLFQKDVEIKYPYSSVLRASAGRWEQEVIINVVTVTGDRNLLLNRSLIYTSNGQTFSTPIVSTKDFSSNITQLVLDQNFLAPAYVVGDTVEVKDSNGTIFVGTIGAVPTSYEISREDQRGIGFKKGQIFTINYGGGLNSLIQVANVSNTGAITDIKFIEYGSGYPNESFNVDLDPSQRFGITSYDSEIINDATQGFGSYGNVYGFNEPNDSTQGFNSYGTVFGFNKPSDKTQGFKSHGAMYLYSNTSPERYFLEDYVNSTEIYVYSEIPAEFGDNVFSAATDTFTTLKFPLKTFTDNVFSAASDTFTTLRFDLASFNDNVTSPSETTFGKPPGAATVTFNVDALGRFPGSFITNEGFISELDIRIQNDIEYQPFAYQTNTELDISDFFDIVTQLIHPAGQRLVNNRVLTASVDFNSNITIESESNIFTEALSVFDVLDLYTANIGKNESDSVDALESNSYVLTKPIIEDPLVTLDDNSLLINLVYNDSVTVAEQVQFDFATFAEHEAVADSLALVTLNKEVLNISNVSISESAVGSVQGYFSESYAAEDYTGFSFTLV